MSYTSRRKDEEDIVYIIHGVGLDPPFFLTLPHSKNTNNNRKKWGRKRRKTIQRQQNRLLAELKIRRFTRTRRRCARSKEDEAGLDFRVARAGLVRLDQLPLSVTLLHVDGLPVGGVAEDAVAGAAHADVAVHGHGLALHAHRVVHLQPLCPVRVEAVLVGPVHLEMPAVPATHTNSLVTVCVCVGGGRGGGR